VLMEIVHRNVSPNFVTTLNSCNHRRTGWWIWRKARAVRLRRIAIITRHAGSSRGTFSFVPIGFLWARLQTVGTLSLPLSLFLPGLC
jgi:hypothetical protein